MVAYWAKVMTPDGNADAMYALDSISTKDFLRKLSKRVGTIMGEARS
jgi:hypothetical protein